MRDWLAFVTAISAVIIDAIALLIVIVGTVEAALGSIGLMFGSPTGEQRRGLWLRYARWLVAALTFQLASDIIETSIAPSWDEVGKLAVIAVIRTVLNYFLEKDVGDIGQRQRGASVG
jgi:uncharacterized membrane protein